MTNKNKRKIDSMEIIKTMDGKFDILLTKMVEGKIYKIDINCNGHKYTGKVRSVK